MSRTVVINVFFYATVRRMADAFVPIHQFADLLQGVAFRGALQDELPGSTRVLSMANALGDRLDEPLDLPTIKFAGDESKFLVQEGDLIFRARGVSNQALLVGGLVQSAIFAAPLIRIRVHDTARVDPAYFQWAINSGPVQRAVDAVAKGSIVRMVAVSSLRDLRIPLPALDLQRRIAEFARLQREEQQLSTELIAKRQTMAEQVFWANAQKVR